MRGFVLSVIVGVLILIGVDAWRSPAKRPDKPLNPVTAQDGGPWPTPNP